jgi:hypothetical protein
MKIGLTISDSSIFANGVSQNVVFIYYLLDSIYKNNVFFISTKKNHTIKDKPFIDIENIEELKQLDVIFSIGLSLKNEEKVELKKTTILIKIILGNTFICDTFGILSNSKLLNKDNIAFNHDNFDEIWILPDYEFSIDYYKYVSNNDNIYVAPFVWEPYFIKNKLDNVDMTKLNIGVFEPNITPNKSSFIPIIICEKAKDIIEDAMIFCSRDLAINNSSFEDFCKLSSLFKSGRLTCENRHVFFDMMNKHCNVVISYVDNWDLNYLLLECFYLGIPLIHNSYLLKDWGYYYPKCDVLTAVKHLENLKENGFDRKAYIEKHKEILFKYSIKNLDNINFFKDRISSATEKKI